MGITMVKVNKFLKPAIGGLILAAGIIAGSLGAWAAARLKWELASPQRRQNQPAGQMSSQISPTAAPTITLEGIAVYPVNGSALTNPPERVYINLKQEITGPASIAIYREETAIKTPRPPELADERRSISLGLPADLGEGEYVVTYQACFDEAEKNCVRGDYKFSVQK